MIFTYGGVPLLFDQNQEVQEFLDKYQSLDDLVDQVEPTALTSGRTDNRSGNGHLVGLPVPNYPDPPKIRLNQLYWPTGASRWARGYFLVDDGGKSTIVGLSQSSGGSNSPLVLQTGDLTTSLTLLTPRKVSAESRPRSSQLWILPLVDDRYFWQHLNFGDNETTTATTWAGLFSTLGSQLGATINADTVDSAYLIPDPEELSRKYDNAAAILDAVAHSVGMRVIRKLDGGVEVNSWATSQTQLANNLRPASVLIAGGSLSADAAPATVDFVCPKIIELSPIPDEVFQYSESPSSSTLVADGTSHAIHSTAYADFSTGGVSPDNNTALAALAAKAAEDFYDSLDETYDRTFQGIRNWIPQGYDDHTLYNFGGESPHSTLRAQTFIQQGNGLEATTKLMEERERCLWTRIQSSPANFGTEQQLSQDTSITPLFHYQFGKISPSPISADAAGNMDVWISDDPDDPSITTTSVTSPLVTIEIYNFTGETLETDAEVFAWFNYESKRWFAAPLTTDYDWILRTDDALSRTITNGLIVDLGGINEIETAFVSATAFETNHSIGNKECIVRGTVSSGDFTAATSTITLTASPTKIFGKAPASGALTVHNIIGASGSSADVIYAVFSHSDSRWEILEYAAGGGDDITENIIAKGGVGGVGIQDSIWTIATAGQMSVTLAETTNDGIAINTGTLTSGDAISITGAGITTGNGILIQADNLASGGSLISARSNSADTNTRNLTEILNDNTLAVGTTVLSVQQDASNRAVFIDMNGAEGSAIVIDQNSNSSAEQYAIDIGCNNIGAGKPGGIDMSTFSADENLLAVPADGDALADFGTAGHFSVNIGGVSGKVPVFTAAVPFAIPVAASPTPSEDGEMVYDSTTTYVSAGVVKYSGSAQVMGLVSMPEASFENPADGHHVAYNATSNEFELVPGGTTGVADNILVRGDGGTTIQGSGITVGDTDNMSGISGIIADGAVNFQDATLEIPNSTATPTTTLVGQIAMDSDGDTTNITHGVIQYYDGTANRFLFGVNRYPSASGPDENTWVMAYNSSTKVVEWQAQAGGTTAITDNIIPKGTGTDIEDSGWTCTDQDALSASVTSTTTSAIGLTADSISTADGINVSVDGLTSGTGITVTTTASGFAGSLLFVQNNSVSTSPAQVARFVNDNTLATGTVVLDVQQDADQLAVDVIAASATENAVQITADSLGVGSALLVTSSSTSASARTVGEFRNNGSGATGATCLTVTQESNARGFHVNQTGNGIAAQIEQSAVGDPSIDIIQRSNSALDVYAITIDNTNTPGAGKPGGIDMSTGFVAEDPLLKAVSDGGTTADFGTLGQFAVDINGTVGFVPVFEATRRFNVPSSDSGSVSTEGDMVIDSLVTDWSTGIIRVYASNEEQGLVTMPISEFTKAKTTGDVPTYNATNDEFELLPQTGSYDFQIDSDDSSPTTVADGEIVDTAGGNGTVTSHATAAGRHTVTIDTGEQWAKCKVVSGGLCVTLGATWKVRAIKSTETGTESGSEFDVKIPVVSGRKPNLEPGDFITYREADDGQKVITSDCMDAEFLSMQMWLGTVAAIPQGWAHMNGTSNDSGVAMFNSSEADGQTQRIPRASSGTGVITNSADGDDNHTHVAHDQHSHSIPTTPNQLAEDLTNSRDIADACTGVAMLDTDCTVVASSGARGHTPSAHIMRHQLVHFIERIDNTL